MNKAPIFILLLTFTVSYQSSIAQTLYVPSGSSGIGTSSNANVGVGTSTPVEKLTVKGNLTIEGVSGVTHSQLSFYRATSHKFATIGQGDLNADNSTFDFTHYNNNDFRFMQGTSERLRITSAGDVGIGMNTPDARLSLQAAAPGNLVTMKASGSTALLRMGLTTGYAWIQSFGSTPLRINDAGNDVLINVGSGNVGIGTSITDAKLTVLGVIHSNEVRVDLNVPGPDYVFEKNYDLPSLMEVENYINKNKHLPEVPAAKEMEANGVNLGEMNMLLLKKVEELTLYLIELKKEIEILKKQNAPKETATK